MSTTNPLSSQLPLTEAGHRLSLAEMAGSMILQSTGENLEREGLQRTPQRFSLAMRELTSGYQMTAQEVVGSGIFEAEGKGLVSVREIEFYSLCEHHMLPFWGRASVAYYPGKKILGLSKIPRLLDVFARRFQVQERLTEQLGKAMLEILEPRAVGVRISAEHMCMMMRGVKKQGSSTVTEFSQGMERLSSIEADRLWKSLE